MNNLEMGLWKEHGAEAKAEVESSRSQHSHHLTLPPNMLPEKTYQLLQNNTVHQVLGLSAVSTGCLHKSLTDLEGRGVNQ